MAAATDFARSTGASIIQLETEVGNVVAQALYEKEGWSRDSNSTHYSLPL
jgi:ribosomal protein S18 acetylase RimI-like enzyme